MLIVKNIIKTFHNKKVLDDVSFQAATGQIVVLLGQSGVGKSTMLRVLSNLETIDSGTLELNQKPLDFKKVGMVFQDFNLFAHLTVLENITLPLIKVAGKSEQEAQQIALSMLQRFNITNKAQAYPASLSGGQKQRVALARALAMNPKILCLDEPTSALDPQLTAEVAQILMQLAQQQIILIIATHDIGLLKQLDATIHLMQHGKIIETATTKLLKENSEKFTSIKKFIEGK